MDKTQGSKNSNRRPDSTEPLKPILKSHDKLVVNPKRPTFGDLSHRSEQQESYRKREYQNTGLMKDSSQTQEFILEGFWMQGEFVCFLTLDPTN